MPMILRLLLLLKLQHSKPVLSSFLPRTILSACTAYDPAQTHYERGAPLSYTLLQDHATGANRSYRTLLG